MCRTFPAEGDRRRPFDFFDLYWCSIEPDCGSRAAQALEFSTTTILDRDPNSWPTDCGMLDAEDLGHEVVKALDSAQVDSTEVVDVPAASDELASAA